jgi:hypothetical protein
MDQAAPRPVKSRGSGGPPSKADRRLRARFVLPTVEGLEEDQGQIAVREIIQGEIVSWLASTEAFDDGQSVLCSLPDVSELGLTVDAYRAWWATVAGAIFAKLRPGQFAIFYQSDGKLWEGKARCTGWLSKAALVAEAASLAGATMLWHKIVTFGNNSSSGDGGDSSRRSAGGGSCTMPMAVGRPGFSHLLCYGAPPATAALAPLAPTPASEGPRSTGTFASITSSGDGTHDETPPPPPPPPSSVCASYDPRLSLSPDVFERGPQLWDRGPGLVASHVACNFLASQPQVSSVLSPCCGVGTFPAMANACGLAAVGIELNTGRCKEARELQLSHAALVAYRIETGTLPAPRRRGGNERQEAGGRSGGGGGATSD